MHAYDRTIDLTIFDSIERALETLGRMGLSRDDIVISSNVPTRLDGLPKLNARVPDDPGVALYWKKGKDTRCMAIDRYDGLCGRCGEAITYSSTRAGPGTS